MPDKQPALEVNQNVHTVISLNPGVTFTPTQLRAVSIGQVVVKQGCVKRLHYFSNGEDLTFVELDPDGIVTASNLKDFRERFEQAACCGQRVLFCFDTKTRKISMLHVFPCRCACDKRD